MALSNNEVLSIWGRKLLTDRGHIVSSDATVSVELSTESDGCCDVCSSEIAVIQVISKGIWVTISGYQFEDILLELVEISRKM